MADPDIYSKFVKISKLFLQVMYTYCRFNRTTMIISIHFHIRKVPHIGQRPCLHFPIGDPCCFLLLSKCLKRVYFILITIFLFLAHLVYEKVKKALTSDSLKKGIMKASPYAQTDCLEGFHSVLNFFAPKIIAYFYLGMFCR